MCLCFNEFVSLFKFFFSAAKTHNNIVFCCSNNKFVGHFTTQLNFLFPFLLYLFFVFHFALFTDFIEPYLCKSLPDAVHFGLRIAFVPYKHFSSRIQSYSIFLEHLKSIARVFSFLIIFNFCDYCSLLTGWCQKNCLKAKHQKLKPFIWGPFVLISFYNIICMYVSISFVCEGIKFGSFQSLLSLVNLPSTIHRMIYSTKVNVCWCWL